MLFLNELLSDSSLLLESLISFSTKEFYILFYKPHTVHCLQNKNRGK